MEFQNNIKFHSWNKFVEQFVRYKQHMKTELAILLLLALMGLAECDYFYGVIANQTLADSTSNAIDTLKASLIADFDCSDSSRSGSSQYFAYGGINLVGDSSSCGSGSGRLSSTIQTMFKANCDKSPVSYNTPLVNSPFEDGDDENVLLYNKFITLINYLAQIKQLFIQYNNVLLGSYNVVNGSQNFVVGSRDSLSGNNNWVFTSDLNLNTVVDGVLIIGNYLIEIIDIPLILDDPQKAIKCISTDDSNIRFSKWWNAAPANHKTCV